MTARSPRILLAVAALASTLAAVSAGACGGPPPMPPLGFATPSIVDPVRAGGEPVIAGLPDGTLIYATHAGNTHLYKPNLPDPDFVTPHTGANFVFRSTDDGATWRYVGFAGTETGPHAAVTGFSDPALAVDAAGTVYEAGITSANTYVSWSRDSGRTWEGNTLAAFFADREWLAADEPGVVYLNANARGRQLWKSSDGGASWNHLSAHALPGDGPPSPIAVDPVDGRLYFPAGDIGGVDAVAVYPGIRADDYTEVLGFVPGGLPHAHGFLNPVAIDRARTVYVVANTERQVRVAYSTDLGATWRTSVVVDAADRVLWPWVSAGSDGEVGVSWLQRGPAVGGQPSWRIYAAQTVSGHGWTDGCGQAQPPAWEVALATPDPIHVGQICENGLACNFSLNADRRLGDYHSNAITASGRLAIAYSNTTFRPESAISRGAFVRQSSGVDFR